MTVLQIRVNINGLDGEYPTEGGLAIDKLLREDSSKEEQMIIDEFYRVCKLLARNLADAVTESGGSAKMTTIGEEEKETDNG